MTAETIWNSIKDILTVQKESVLIYCSDGQHDLEEGERFGRHEFACLLEDTLAKLTKLAAEEGVNKFIVAGGETSGAVTKKLGYKSFYVGESVASGVPVLVPTGSSGSRLILKSGNFGQHDFFIRALEMTKSKWRR